MCEYNLNVSGTACGRKVILTKYLSFAHSVAGIVTDSENTNINESVLRCLIEIRPVMEPLPYSSASQSFVLHGIQLLLFNHCSGYLGFPSEQNKFPVLVLAY